jgi:hypothetical protein
LEDQVRKFLRRKLAHDFRTAVVNQTFSKGRRWQKNGGRKMKISRFALKGGRGVLYFCPGCFCHSLRKEPGIVSARTRGAPIVPSFFFQARAGLAVAVWNLETTEHDPDYA